MRHFLQIAYNGKAYAGWQRQLHMVSVEQVLEETLSILLGEIIEATGCGRTDSGVHATQYFLHFDTDKKTSNLVYKLNRLLPKDIAVQYIYPVAADAHARYDAIERSYQYLIFFEKNPFLEEFGYYYPYKMPDIELMNEGAALLLKFKEFAPFCLSDSGANTMKCDIRRAEWIWDEAQNRLHFHIAANRFLRGMVRLIVGGLLLLGRGKLSLNDLRIALIKQQRLKRVSLAPPHGLYLNSIKYPFIEDKPSVIFEPLSFLKK